MTPLADARSPPPHASTAHVRVSDLSYFVRQPFFPVAQVGAFQNLIRWYDFLSHTADPGRLLPQVRVQMPAFRLPPPPPPPAASKVRNIAVDGSK